MSLRSEANVDPSRPDPVTRNQPQAGRADETTGTPNMPGNYPIGTNDSTSSGGYGASPEQTWSDKAQRGVDLPTGTLSLSLSDNSAGLIDKATDGTDLKNELQDAKQGTDGGIFSQEDEWGIEKGAGKDF